MAEIIKTSPTYFDNLDLSDWDLEGDSVSWSLTQQNSINFDPSITINFAGDAIYKGTTLSIGQQVKIPIGSKNIRGRILNIRFSVSDGKETLSVTIGSLKYMFDQNIDYTGQKGASIIDDLKAIKQQLGISDLDIIGDASIKWSVDQFSVFSNQNLLSKIKEHTSVGKDDYTCNIYFNIFGELHVDPITNKGNVKTISAQEYKDKLLSLDLVLNQPTKQKTLYGLPNTSEPGSKSEKITVNEYKDAKGNRAAEVDVRRGSKADAKGLNVKPDKSVIVSNLTLQLAGLHWDIQPDNKLNIEGFSTGDGEYFVRSITMSFDTYRGITTITGESIKNYLDIK